MSSEQSTSAIRRAQFLLTAFSLSLTLLPLSLEMLACPADARNAHGRSHLIAAASESKETVKAETNSEEVKSGKKDKNGKEKKSDEKKAKAKDRKEEKANESAKEDKAKEDKAKDNKVKAKEQADDKDSKTAKKGFFGRSKDGKEDKADKENKTVKVEKTEKTDGSKKEIVKVKSTNTASPATAAEIEKKNEVREEKVMLFEPDTALISVLKDLNRNLKEPEEQNKIEDANQRMIVGLASDVLNKALNDPKLSFNRILAKEQETKARTRLTAEAWSSGDVAVNDKFHGSLSTVWAKRIDGLVTVTIAGDCHDRKAKDGNDIGEFLVVITAKSPVETGFDIQSQSNVNFWMGKLSNIAVEADCIAKPSEGEADKSEDKADRERKIDSEKKSEDQQKKKSIAALPPLLTNRYRSYYELMIVQDDRRRLIAQQLANMDPSIQLEEAAKKDSIETDAVSKHVTKTESKSEEAEKRAEVKSDIEASQDTESEKGEKLAKQVAEKTPAVGDEKPTTVKLEEKSEAKKELADQNHAAGKGGEKQAKETETRSIEEKLALERNSEKNKSKEIDQTEKVEKIAKAEQAKEEQTKVIVHTKPSTAGSTTKVVSNSTNLSGQKLESTTSALTAGAMSGSSAQNLAMVASPTLSAERNFSASNANVINQNVINQNVSTRPHGRQGNETAYAGAAASMEKVTGLDLPALKQPKNFTMLMPDRALAGQPLTVAFVDDQQNPESNVELSFNGVNLSTDQNGQAQYTIPEDETPGRSLNIALLSRPYEMPSVVEVLQPLATPESAQAPKVDRASHLVSRRSNLVIDGHNFDGVAQNNRVIIDGLIEASIAASSPVQLKVNLPKDLKPGPHSLCVSTEGMRSNPIGFELAQLEVACDANSNKVIVKVVGTTSKVNVKLVNLSPDLIKLTRGEDTRLLSSGGPDNTASISVQRIKKGATKVEAWIDL